MTSVLFLLLKWIVSPICLRKNARKKSNKNTFMILFDSYIVSKCSYEYLQALPITNKYLCLFARNVSCYLCIEARLTFTNWMVMVLFSDSFKIDVLIIFVGAVTLFYWFLRRNYSYWDRKGFKTLPGCHYFVGHLKSTATQKESISNVVLKLYQATNEPFIGFYSLFRPTLMICDPELARTILIKDFANFPERGLHCNEGSITLFF